MRRAMVFAALVLIVSTSLFSQGIGLVFSGGGAKGSYEIGVWKALIDLDIEIGGVYGTSVGSLNAAALAQGDFKKALDLWRDISQSKVITATPAQQVFIDAYGGSKDWSYGELFQGVLEVVRKGIDTEPLRELLTEMIDEHAVRTSKIDFGLVTFDLTDMRPEMLFIEAIPEGKLIDYVMASADFPGFKTVHVDGKAFVDGGVYSNQPVEMALERGFRNIVLVDIGRVSLRDRFAVLQARLSEAKMIHIAPRIQYGSTLDFDPQKAELQIEEGYLDALATYGLVRGEYTYIYEDRDILKELFEALPQEKKSTAIALIGDPVNWKTPESFYSDFYQSLEKIYKTPFPTLSLLDRIASILGLPSLELYSGPEILQEIKKAYKSNGLIQPEKALVPYDKAVLFVVYLQENSDSLALARDFEFYNASFETLKSVKE